MSAETPSLPQPLRRGKCPHWRDDETLAAVMSVVKLPDAAINGARQKKTIWHEQLKSEFDRLFTELRRDHAELCERLVKKVWRSRTGRSVADQASKALKLCRKLHSVVRVVERKKITGSPSEEDKMRCAVGLFNDVIKVSNCYDVICNKAYVIGKEFPYPITYKWLCEKTSELDPVPDDVVHEESPVFAVASVTDEEGNQERVGEKRPIGQKAAKAAKLRKKVDFEEDNVITTALSALSDKLGEVSSATMAAANVRFDREKVDNDREFELKKEADELEAARVLFNDDSEESRRYRQVLKRKRLRKLLQEEEIHKN